MGSSSASRSARGLVARPELVLFDEPLSNLDARLRDQVRIEIHELHTRLGFTAVFVTHDQSEALALGDRLAIMKQGKIEQYDTPERVYEQPASEYVAAFIGISNRLLFDYKDGRWYANGQEVHGASPTPEGSAPSAVRVRSEELELAPVGEAPSAHHCSLPGVVVDTEYGGSHIDVSVDAGDTRVMARLPTAHTRWVGARAAAGRRGRGQLRPVLGQGLPGGGGGMTAVDRAGGGSASPCDGGGSAAAAGSRGPGCSCSSWPSAISS